MKFKQATGLVFHKLLDRKLVFNPITSHFYPEYYKIEYKRLRKLNTDLFFTSPTIADIDFQIRTIKSD